MYIITGWQVLSNLFLLLLALIFTRKALKEPFTIKAFYRIIAIILIFFIYLFSFHDSDYLGYKMIVENGRGHLEEIYFIIIDFIQGNYLLFRLIIFCSAYILGLLALKRLGVGFDICFLCFLITSVTVLSYGRFTLALSLSFLGYSFIIKPFRFWLLSWILGFLLIFFSLSFHNSVLILMPLYFGALLIHEFNKKNIILFFIIVAFLLLLYYLVGSQLFYSIIESDSLENYQANRASSSGSGGSGIAMLIHRFLQYSRYYCSLLLFIIAVMKHDYKNWPLSIKMVSSFFVLVMIVALLFSLNKDTTLLYYRTLYYSSLAMCILLAYCYKMNIQRKFVRFILYLGFFSQLYEISYHAYLAFLGQFVL